MTTANILITASLKLNMDSPTFPKGMTDKEKLDWWIEAARKEPELALIGADFVITGSIEK